jgi:hypothetical protein
MATMPSSSVGTMLECHSSVGIRSSKRFANPMESKRKERERKAWSLSDNRAEYLT